MKKFLFSLLVVTSLFSKEDLFFDRVKLQMFGNIGLVSIGIGGDLSKESSWDFFYGYVPRKYGGVNINTLAIKYNKDFWNLSSKNQMYYGIGLMHVLNQRYQSTFRDEYPETNYYEATSIHLLPYLGLKSKRDFFGNDVKAYIEVGTIDLYLVNWYKNQETLTLGDVVNIAFGVGYDF
ncbi:MAG: hypothetical protein OIF32_02635 [Campylobacterales bacterium]|nr:hypothetical protein [Campylobacterales bacterium]